MSGEAPRRGMTGKLPVGVEAFEAPHLFLPHTILVYHRTLIPTGWHPRVLILRWTRVTYLDRRGARSFALVAKLCRERRTLLLLGDVHPETRQGLGRGGVMDDIGPGDIFPRREEALRRARDFLGQRATEGPA